MSGVFYPALGVGVVSVCYVGIAANTFRRSLEENGSNIASEKACLSESLKETSKEAAIGAACFVAYAILDLLREKILYELPRKGVLAQVVSYSPFPFLVFGIISTLGVSMYILDTISRLGRLISLIQKENEQLARLRQQGQGAGHISLPLYPPNH